MTISDSLAFACINHRHTQVCVIVGSGGRLEPRHVSLPGGGLHASVRLTEGGHTHEAAALPEGVAPEWVCLDLVAAYIGRRIRRSLPFEPDEASQFMCAISHSLSARVRTRDVVWRGKMAFKSSKATVRLCETPNKRATASPSEGGSRNCTSAPHTIIADRWWRHLWIDCAAWAASFCYDGSNGRALSRANDAQRSRPAGRSVRLLRNDCADGPACL
jgi:hypothetical protein